MRVHLKGFDIHGRVSSSFCKGDSICYFLFAVLQTIRLLKSGHLYEEGICSQGTISFLSGQAQFQQGNKNNADRVVSLEKNIQCPKANVSPGKS